MRNLFLALSFLICLAAVSNSLPWEHGRLTVSANGSYLQHADGTPFFWLGDTGWLLPEKLDRDQAAQYLNSVAEAGFNIVQVQVLNDVPSNNVFGNKSHYEDWSFDGVDLPDSLGYWQHMDYIIDKAAEQGIYIGMVCIWGGLVKSGKMDVSQAQAYGQFLAERYSDKPNIVWIIGGDIKGDVKPDVWETLAKTIKEYDGGHLMTFHPFGRTSSAYWWNDAEWLDFNMYQSGHRRYDQTRGDGDDTAAAAVAEDNWRYVADALNREPLKPIIDAEPSYEEIPHGLHDTTQPRWGAADMRRYAYWSVFAGAAGHTYGHNSIMQMYTPGDTPAYGAFTPWYEALNAEGRLQMRHVKALMSAFDFGSRVPDQSIIVSDNGNRYERAIATRGNDFILVYTYTNNEYVIDLDKIPGDMKTLWWYNPRTGEYEYIANMPSGLFTMQHLGPVGPGNDWVLVAVSVEPDSNLTVFGW